MPSALAGQRNGFFPSGCARQFRGFETESEHHPGVGIVASSNGAARASRRVAEQAARQGARSVATTMRAGQPSCIVCAAAGTGIVSGTLLASMRVCAM